MIEVLLKGYHHWLVSLFANLLQVLYYRILLMSLILNERLHLLDLANLVVVVIEFPNGFLIVSHCCVLPSELFSLCGRQLHILIIFFLLSILIIRILFSVLGL